MGQTHTYTQTGHNTSDCESWRLQLLSDSPLNTVKENCNSLKQCELHTDVKLFISVIYEVNFVSLLCNQWFEEVGLIEFKIHTQMFWDTFTCNSHVRLSKSVSPLCQTYLMSSLEYFQAVDTVVVAQVFFSVWEIGIKSSSNQMGC